jgi:hypothetical protein
MQINVATTFVELFETKDHLSQCIVKNKFIKKIVKQDNISVAAGLPDDTWHMPPRTLTGTAA